MPKFVPHSQRTPEWVAWRKNKITASNVATIMQLNPHKTPLMLYTELLDGTETTVTEAMERGVALEPEARKWAENQLEIVFDESCAEDDELEWLASSLDGYNDAFKTAIELKCMGKKGHQEAKLGVVKPLYFPQLQCQMRVYNLDWMYYISYDPDEGGEIIKVQRDDKFIEKMLPMLADFRRRLISFDPPDPMDKDLDTLDDEESMLLSVELDETKKSIKSRESRKKEIENRLKVISKNRSCKIGDRRFVKYMCKGNIDNEKIAEDYCIDLEKYRKPHFEKWLFT